MWVELMTFNAIKVESGDIVHAEPVLLRPDD
jgi:hypothetical protein